MDRSCEAILSILDPLVCQACLDNIGLLFEVEVFLYFISLCLIAGPSSKLK